jgi:formylglycine-generating enzyme required for sulfatase activity
MTRHVIDVRGYRKESITDLRDATQAQMKAALSNSRTHEGKLWQWLRPGKSDVTVFYSVRPQSPCQQGAVHTWGENCKNDIYSGAPSNGEAWTNGNCSMRVLRGGSWKYLPRLLRSAIRYWFITSERSSFLGFRIARTLYLEQPKVTPFPLGRPGRSPSRFIWKDYGIE